MIVEWMCWHWQYLTEFRLCGSIIKALAMQDSNTEDKGVVSVTQRTPVDKTTERSHAMFFHNK